MPITLNVALAIPAMFAMEPFGLASAVGSPSTRRAVAQIPKDGLEEFIREVRAMLHPYLIDGKLAYPMESHILLARV